MDFLLETNVCLSVAAESREYRQFPRSMSNPGLTSEAQLRYILQWFGEFSELQREDFLPVLAAAHGGKPDQLASTLASLSCEDKPVSLFQCRIKLFNEWFPTWAEEERDRLIKAVSEIDSDFGTKLQDALVNGIKLNGDLDEEHKLHFGTEIATQENTDEPSSNEHTETVTSQENTNVEIAAAS
ncbi:unnamed protein product [Euphydryas editha]|uniref:Uncharacterized protein n=1 Tax=Euphydryas editha TaxID=104508 RepID=A0AAU9U9P1_EUPED|nr:unnamed protein product [Euphydryas editha]